MLPERATNFTYRVLVVELNLSTARATTTTDWNHSSITNHNSLYKVHKTNEDQIGRIDLQIQANSRKSNEDGRKRLHSLKRGKKSLVTRRAHVVDNINNLFGAFFMHRQRDIAEEIQVETGKSFSEWIKYCPEIFVSRESGLKIKYIGAHLCDEKYKVRIQALKTLDVAYKNDGRFSVPTLFTKQWTERMVELTRDRHEKVVVEACKLLKTISYLDITRRAYSEDGERTERENFTKLSKLLFAEESTIRRSVAGVIITILNREPIFSAEEETYGRSKNNVEMDVDDEETTNAESNVETAATANASLTSGSDTENEEDSNKGADIAKDLAIEEQNKIQLLNLLNLFKEFKLGAAYAPHLVDAFYPYDEVSAVHDFKYLANGLASQDLNGWSPEEVDIVVAIFADIVRREAGAKDLHDEPKLFLKNEDGVFMLQRLPDLLIRFQGDIKRATQLAKLVRYIDLNTLNNRNVKHFKKLFGQLHVIFLQANVFNPETGMTINVDTPEQHESQSSNIAAGSPSGRKMGLATLGLEAQSAPENHMHGSSKNKYVANRMIEHLLSDDLDSEKNVLRLISESIGHLVQPSHLEREAKTSLRKLCQELVDQIKENFELCKCFSNEYDGENIDVETDKKICFHFDVICSA